jgi:hypothetical protein
LDDDSDGDARTVDRLDYMEKINTWKYIPEMAERMHLDYSNLNVQFNNQDQLSDDNWVTDKSSEEDDNWVIDESSEEDEPEVDIIGGEDARNFMFASQAYERLIARIQAASGGRLLTCPNGQVIEEIRDSILRILLPEPVVNQAAKQAVVSCSFQVSWQPLKFLKEQYSAGYRQAIADVITLTGSAISDTQAITCREYVDQVWPRLGNEVLEALQAAINHTVDSKDGKKICLIFIIIINIDNRRSTSR